MVKHVDSRRLQKIRLEYKTLRPQPCMRCGQPIDYDAPPNDPNSFNLGHIKAYADFPELREDPANLRQEHSRCNKSAGKSSAPVGIGNPTRVW